MPYTLQPNRWLIGSRDQAAEGRLIKELAIPSVVAAVLVQRGYTEPEDAKRFLNPRLDDLHDPRLLPDFETAAGSILGARERKERIFVHGDYDVDGVTSAALLSRFLGAIGCDVTTHVPHRMREGYGISTGAVEAAKNSGAKLFVTCDCGTNAYEQVAMARAAGMNVVVTDHHTIGGALPEADAVVNPHRTDSKYPFAELSGVGVALKMCAGITADLGHDPLQFYRAYLDLAALGTIADVMPLVDENRIIAKFGLERLRETKKIGLQALMSVANLEAASVPALRAYHVGFILGPRLNAAGRVDDAAIALQLLMSTDPQEATELAKKIDGLNAARKAEQQRISDAAIATVLENGFDQRNVIVVADPSWNGGVVGIVAGKLVERFRRPAFVMSVDVESQTCRGSARTIPHFHLADAIRSFPDLFTTGGGHAMAAGCTFPLANLDKIRDALHAYAAERLTEEDFVQALRVDMELDYSEVTIDAAMGLKQLEPFGCENPEPVFAVREATLAQVTPTKNPQHAQVVLAKNGCPSLKGIAFEMGDRLTQTGPGETVDALMQLTIDEWRGAQSLKVKLKDYKSANAAKSPAAG